MAVSREDYARRGEGEGPLELNEKAEGGERGKGK